MQETEEPEPYDYDGDYTSSSAASSVSSFDTVPGRPYEADGSPPAEKVEGQPQNGTGPLQQSPSSKAPNEKPATDTTAPLAEKRHMSGDEDDIAEEHGALGSLGLPGARL